MVPYNYHLHSAYSGDCDASLEAMCEAAVDAGLREVCFTDHYDFDRDDPAYGYFRYGPYMAGIEEARARFAGRLVIRSGLEFDFRREYGDEPAEVLSQMAFDFRIGSVHSALGLPIYRLSRDGVPAGLDLRELQAAYFDEVEALVGTGLLECLGHFDYLYKQAPAAFATLRDAWYWERVERILALAVERGVAIEVNSHHVEDRGCALAADAEILKRYRALGGRLVTAGSDAHTPEDVPHGYDRLASALREAGITKLATCDAGEFSLVAL